MLRWDRYRFNKKHVETHCVELVFSHLVGSAGHVVHSVVSGARNVIALYFKLGWARCSFHKNCAGIRYAKLVFLHPAGLEGHVVHSGAFGARNIDALFSCSGRPDVVLIKLMPGHITPNLCFHIRWDLWVM
jgi:hypothetical protein